jgi:hypothetical protein
MGGLCAEVCRGSMEQKHVVKGLMIEGFFFLPDTPGKIHSSSGRIEEKDNILLACRK